ncbi:glucokinase [Undibacterium oligocarboniphilum]|uniref:Glucokinase n=1 Tax=Undibacterium oligocarboniphilum TaxID=666702 RepID=A0A850QMH9_9BURK|nr:glucokinase [Undibacterium oligocarboniphilum]MBC3869552.1 glucokinase [Undibacterium oligocarboniphilum]NVO77930.1 glucokinase [Undibacterium oligocarboniphilum]
MSYPKLLADIGGTNARFALETAQGQIEAVQVLPCAGYASLSLAMRAYLQDAASIAAGAAEVRQAGIAIANPVHDDQVQMTNHHWSFSITAVQAEFGLDSLIVVNDFTALAMSLPMLSTAQKYQAGGQPALPKAAIGLLGAGTGLGVSGLVWTENAWVPLHSEGGHVSFTPANALEIDILRFAWQEFEHVSAERLLSGPGLRLIYRALAARRQKATEETGGTEKAAKAIDDIDAPEILLRGLDNTCPLCREVLSVFCDMLGTMAGNLAVTLGARGGIYIGGGIVPRLGDFLLRSGFRQRFEQKGRFSAYLAEVPVYVITEAYPAFIGLSAILTATEKSVLPGTGADLTDIADVAVYASTLADTRTAHDLPEHGMVTGSGFIPATASIRYT